MKNEKEFIPVCTSEVDNIMKKYGNIIRGEINVYTEYQMRDAIWHFININGVGGDGEWHVEQIDNYLKGIKPYTP